jgi:hypothetical protein
MCRPSLQYSQDIYSCMFISTTCFAPYKPSSGLIYNYINLVRYCTYNGSVVLRVFLATNYNIYSFICFREPAIVSFLTVRIQ